MAELAHVKAFNDDGLKTLNDIVDHLNTGINNSDVAAGAGIFFSKIRYYAKLDVAVSATEKAIPHGFGVVPIFVIPVSLTAGVTVRRSRKSDRTHVYLTASGAGTADVLVLA